MEWHQKNENCCWIETDGNKTLDTVGKLIKLRLFGCKNLQTLATKIGHNNFYISYRRCHCLLPVGNQTCKNLKLDAEFPIYVQAQQPEDRLESMRLSPFYSIQNLHVWFFMGSSISRLKQFKVEYFLEGWPASKSSNEMRYKRKNMKEGKQPF